ncbi:MAG: nuclear transport factor 2 family protein [Pseudonocardiales bacterium]|nr:nuclear transport factor 2 family protein [Pseudonocardiales bacterium]
MDPGKVAHAYFQAWNDHDGADVAALFAPDGTYIDPTLPGPLSGRDIATYVTRLVATYPDLAFVVERISVDGDQATAQWRMQGTNTGPFNGIPEPTGGICDLPGVDLITVGARGITSVVGYFDQKTLAEQLGCQALIVRQDDLPLHFGTSKRTDLGITTVPGALTMTWIDVDNDEESNEVGQRVNNIVESLSSEPGFIGSVSAYSGHRGHTLTAWVSPEAAEAAIGRNVAHGQARERALDGKLGSDGFTSIWIPHRLNDQLHTCPDCGRMLRIGTGATSALCGCGGEVAITSYL